MATKKYQDVFQESLQNALELLKLEKLEKEERLKEDNKRWDELMKRLSAKYSPILFEFVLSFIRKPEFFHDEINWFAQVENSLRNGEDLTIPEDSSDDEGIDIKYDERVGYSFIQNFRLLDIKDFEDPPDQTFPCKDSKWYVNGATTVVTRAQQLLDYMKEHDMLPAQCSYRAARDANSSYIAFEVTYEYKIIDLLKNTPFKRALDWYQRT